MNEPLRIAINARLLPGQGAGGTESVLIGLVAALGRLNDGPEEYVIITNWEAPDWMTPYLGDNQRIVVYPKSQKRKTFSEKLEPLKRATGPLRPFFRSIRHRLRSSSSSSGIRGTEVPVSDGFYESLGCDVIHFPYQNFTLCALPSIYNPHDLQHLHYPQFFHPKIIAWREVVYPFGCRLADTVVVASNWIKEDIVKNYRITPEKVQVIPWAPPTQAYSNPEEETLENIKGKYSLQLPFAFYPAMTWEHKNHLRLLEALANLRDNDGLIINLVCTGARISAFWPKIEETIKRHNLSEQVKFPGMVPSEDLRAIYRLAQFVIIPTLYEAASGPLFEAWQDNVPAACSNVTSLPEQARDAALLFDPFKVEDIEAALKRMSTDRHLRSELVKRGAERLKDFSWKRTAKAYRAVYRRAAKRTLTEEDRQLLQWNWMSERLREEKTST